MSSKYVSHVTLSFSFQALLCFGNEHKDFFSVSYTWCTIRHFFQKFGFRSFEVLKTSQTIVRIRWISIEADPEL